MTVTTSTGIKGDGPDQDKQPPVDAPGARTGKGEQDDGHGHVAGQPGSEGDREVGSNYGGLLGDGSAAPGVPPARPRDAGAMSGDYAAGADQGPRGRDNYGGVGGSSGSPVATEGPSQGDQGAAREGDPPAAPAPGPSGVSTKR